MSHELVYFADPMCSWCWGFFPVMEKVRKKFVGRFTARLVLGGLYPDTATPLNISAKKTIREHWQHVHQASGQPFDFSFFDREGFI